MIEESAEYRCLRSQYSVLHNDTIQIKDQIEEYHAHIQTLNATFANKMEMTEVKPFLFHYSLLLFLPILIYGLGQPYSNLIYELTRIRDLKLTTSR